MFIFIGFLAFHAGMTQQLFDAARKWVGWVPGGLAVSTVFATAGFAAVSGASTATAAVFSRVADVAGPAKPIMQVWKKNHGAVAKYSHISLEAMGFGPLAMGSEPCKYWRHIINGRQYGNAVQFTVDDFK